MLSRSTGGWGRQAAENWLHSPRRNIGRAIGRLRRSRGHGTIMVPLDTRQLWWSSVATGAAGTCWRHGQHVRALIKPGASVLLGPGGATMELTDYLLALRLDSRAVRGDALTSPGLRGRAQTALARRLRGGHDAVGLHDTCDAGVDNALWE